MQAAPSQAELLYKNYKVIKENLKSKTKDTIMEKYDNAATEGEIPRELLLGQSEREVEYDRVGRSIKGKVERFAGLYTSQVTNLSLYSLDKYYRPSEDFMPHEFDILAI